MRRASRAHRFSTGCGLVLLLVALFWLVGCQGWGDPPIVEMHSFGRDTLPVYAAPLFAPLFTNGAVVNGAQFSPDGSWLYVWYGAGDGDTFAGATLTSGATLDVRVRVRSGCFLVCAADATLGATRVPLSPPVDAAHPPKVTSDGSAVRVAPWGS